MISNTYTYEQVSYIKKKNSDCTILFDTHCREMSPLNLVQETVQCNSIVGEKN